MAEATGHMCVALSGLNGYGQPTLPVAKATGYRCATPPRGSVVLNPEMRVNIIKSQLLLFLWLHNSEEKMNLKSICMVFCSCCLLFGPNHTLGVSDVNPDPDHVYDVIIVGGGVSGLTAAYMLRDQDILLFEKNERLGGRIWTEQIDGVPYNIGTQFLGEEDNSFVRMLDELGIQRNLYSIVDSPVAAYVGGEYFHDLTAMPLGFGDIIELARIVSIAYRNQKIFRLDPDHPDWQEQSRIILADIIKTDSDRVMAIFSAYLRAACVAKPERVSAGAGANLLGDVYSIAPIAHVEGGTQQITDTMATSLKGKVFNNSPVKKVGQGEGIVQVAVERNGETVVFKAKNAVMATSAPIALALLPDSPAWKKKALEKVEYGSIITVNLFFDQIPWKRFVSMLANDLIFSGVIDTTYMADTSGEKPTGLKVLNVFISTPPSEKALSKAMLSKSDQEIVSLVLNDFQRVFPDVDVSGHVTGTRVTRFSKGEVSLTPEFFKLLPDLQKPVGNIHFSGDYTDRSSFLMGAVLSGFRVARVLGSSYVVSEADEIRNVRTPNWGAYGSLTLIVCILIFLIGFYLSFKRKIHPYYSKFMMTISFVMLILTIVYPFYLPPFQAVYQMLCVLILLFALLGYLVAKIWTRVQKP